MNQISGRHKSFQRLGGAALPANMVDPGVSRFVFIPGHQGEMARGKALFKAEHIAQGDHPPVVRVELCCSTNVTCKRFVPRHRLPSPRTACCPLAVDATSRFSSLNGSGEKQYRNRASASIHSIEKTRMSY